MTHKEIVDWYSDLYGVLCNNRDIRNVYRMELLTLNGGN